MMSVDHPRFRGLQIALMVVVPALAAAWVGWGVVNDPTHLTDLHTNQMVGQAVLDGETFYTSRIPGQFLLTPVGALGGVLLLPMSEPVLHIGWMLLCAAAVLVIGYRAGLRGVILGVIAAFVIMGTPGQVTSTQGSLTLLFMLAAVIDLLDWPKRPRWLPRGLLTGLSCAIWPFVWPFIAILLLTDRARRRAGFVALGTFGVVSLAVAAVLPRMTLVYWTEVFPARFTQQESNLASTNHSILAAAGRLFGPDTAVPALLVTALAGGISIAAAVCWGRLGRPWLMISMGAVAMFTTSPVVPHSDLAWILLPVVAAVLFRRETPVGLSIIIIFALAWILGDPLGALPELKQVADFSMAERLVTAMIPLAAIALAVVGLVDALVVARQRADPEAAPAATERFWLHPAVLVVGTLLLTVGTASWHAANSDADVNAFLGWDPDMPDFDVYIRAAQSFLAHQPLYAAAEGQWPFLYPPFAALLAIPLGAFPRGVVQFGWLVLTTGGLVLLLRRLGLRGWSTAFATMVCIFLVGPIRSTIGLGQVSVLLMVMCLLDIAPGRGMLAPPGRDRLLPRGVLIGLAAAIKLTPGLFIPLLWFSGYRKSAIVATATMIGATIVGFIISPRQSLFYWSQVALGRLEFFPDPRGWMHNQSFVSAWQRFVGLDDPLTLVGIALGGILTLVGLAAAIRWVRLGNILLGASLCGLAAQFVLPVAWNHYFVWALPLGVALFRPADPTAQPPRPGVPPVLQIVGLYATAWLAVEPFWGVSYAGAGPLEFVHWGLLEKVVAGGGAMLSAALVIVALTCKPVSAGSPATPAPSAATAS